MYDHRAIAKAMNLFHFEEHSPGMVFWHPMGLRVFRTIEDFMRRVYQSHGLKKCDRP
jgi:threonyl-tRNA synthetase